MILSSALGSCSGMWQYRSVSGTPFSGHLSVQVVQLAPGYSTKQVGAAGTLLFTQQRVRLAPYLSTAVDT